MDEASPAFHLLKAREREHILSAIALAVDAWPTVVAAIAESDGEPEARERLRAELGIEELQAQAVLDVQLRRLTGHRRAQIQEELVQLRAGIVELTTQVSSGTGGGDVE